MTGDSQEDLRKAVEQMHKCNARLVQSVPIREQFARATVCEGVVHVYEITGHPKATAAYAWLSPIEGRDTRRFFALLHLPPVTSPVAAVQVSIGAEHRRGGYT